VPRVRVFKRRGKWNIEFRPEGKHGPRVRRVMPVKPTADRVACKIEVELIEGTYLDRKKISRTTFASMSAAYLKFSKASKRSWRRDRTSLRALGSTFGGQRLADIKPRAIDAYKAARLSEVSAQSVRHELQCLRHMFVKAIEWGDATENPALAVKKPPARNATIRYLSADEEARLFAQLAPHLVPIVTVAIYAGLRETEILTLRWCDVDFDNDIIHVEDTKNDRRRDVPMAKLVGCPTNSLI